MSVVGAREGKPTIANSSTFCWGRSSGYPPKEAAQSPSSAHGDDGV